MRLGRPQLPIVQYRCKTANKSRLMRARSEWTPRGIALWLIAAILATLVVCTQTRPEDPPPEAKSPTVEFEVLE
jgi:hypothetical protein